MNLQEFSIYIQYIAEILRKFQKYFRKIYLVGTATGISTCNEMEAHDYLSWYIDRKLSVLSKKKSAC